MQKIEAEMPWELGQYHALREFLSRAPEAAGRQQGLSGDVT